jgi:SAM-dependent methyltransferase
MYLLSACNLEKILEMGIYKINLASRINKLLLKWRSVKNTKWVHEHHFTKRVYRSYQEYVSHQGSKLSLLNLSVYDEKYKNVLIERYQQERANIRGKSLLCLGARTGSECQAFIKLGAFSVGVDLNPGQGNKYVLIGDFHNIQFHDESIDAVYTNALDHSFDLSKVINEVKRLLKNNGFFFAEIVKGDKDANGRSAGDFESLWWDNCVDIAREIESYGFKQVRCDDFSFPWNGTRFVFTKLEG